MADPKQSKAIERYVQIVRSQDSLFSYYASSVSVEESIGARHLAQVALYAAVLAAGYATLHYQLTAAFAADSAKYLFLAPVIGGIAWLVATIQLFRAVSPLHQVVPTQPSDLLEWHSKLEARMPASSTWAAWERAEKAVLLETLYWVHQSAREANRIRGNRMKVFKPWFISGLVVLAVGYTIVQVHPKDPPMPDGTSQTPPKATDDKGQLPPEIIDLKPPPKEVEEKSDSSQGFTIQLTRDERTRESE